MNIKKYTVLNIQEGWKKIKDDLGEEAIILSVKEIGGHFEIIAASPGKYENIFSGNIHLLKLYNFVKGLENAELPEKIKDYIQEEIVQSYTSILENYPVNIEKKIKKNPFEKNYILVFGNVSSGKSITIAKLASILKFEKHKKVCIASFDYYKIGGSESLFSFAEIMQIPYFQIKDEKDLILHKDYLDEFDHILFDTPGNIENLRETENLLLLVSKSSKTENILVLPLTKKETLLEKDVKYFCRFNISHMILTKYDQIESPISLYFVLSSFEYPVSYITNGVNVPQDIFPAEKLLTEKVI